MEELTGLEVAIIGMSGRFPQADDVETFWQNLRDGVPGITFFSEETLRQAGLDDEVLRTPNFVPAKGALADETIQYFDASFFGFTPREAEILDPQHRLFLECAWEALESAGYNPDTYPGQIGVYGGTGLSTYLLSNLSSNPEVVYRFGVFPTRIANDKDYVTTRVSYKLNLRGPSMTVQSACSTSLVAVHLACQSLLAGESDMVLAGGVSIQLPNKIGYVYQEGGIQSPDGYCRAFDAQAQGTVVGDGVGVVLLKRLDDALQEGDSILAVVKGSAVNNDGAVKVGYTAPRMEGQVQVIEAAQFMAEVSPETIGYVEAHGTGTPLGDPIEIAALTRAFRRESDKKGFCAIGSVKTSIGHLDPAAGIAGLIKTVLTLQHGMIPPSLNFREPNPKIDFAGSPFYVNNRLTAWEPGDGPRRAAVSSFGIGGTNAHAILEEAPPRSASSPSRPWQLLLWSARTETAVAAMTNNLTTYLQNSEIPSLADVAYTLQVGRKRFRQRRMLVCHSQEDALAALTEAAQTRIGRAADETQIRPVMFLFPGQGAQYAQMGWGLYAQEAVFKAAVDRCCESLRPHLAVDLRQVLFPETMGTTETRTQYDLGQTWLTQPAVFTISYALAQLWQSWGIVPQGMIGHSIGEYVAACLAGVFSLEDALALLALRGRLMQSVAPGRMLAVAWPEMVLQQALAAGNWIDLVSIAAINGPNSCVVAGPPDVMMACQDFLEEQGAVCRPLHTSHAFHSQMMADIVPEFVAAVSKLNLQQPQQLYVSNLTGTWIKAEEATDPAYWGQHLRQAVRFAAGVQTLMDGNEAILLEVGPGRTLGTLARQQARHRVILTSLRHPKEETDDVAHLLHTLGQLWLAGGVIEWQGFYGAEQRQRVKLPTYPFERQRYWIEPRQQATVTAGYGGDNGANGHHETSELVMTTERPVENQYARPELSTAYVAPTNEMETDMVAVWQAYLGITPVGIHDSFFDLGGDSLLAIQVLAQLRQMFEVDIPMAILFETATVAALSKKIILLKTTEQDEASSLVVQPVSRQGILPLTVMQERLWWLIESGYSQPTIHVFTTGWYLTGSVDVSALEQSMNVLLERHEMLRTTFVVQDGVPGQRVHAPVTMPVRVVDLRGVVAEQREQARKTAATETAETLFDLSQVPLMRVTLIRLEDAYSLLLMAVHRLAIDGWSMGLLLTEFMTLYKAFYAHETIDLPALPLQYGDFSSWQRNWLTSEAAAKAANYWRPRFEALPSLPLPSDRPDFEGPITGAMLPFTLSVEMTEMLREFSRQQGGTLYMTLLTAYISFLHEYTGWTEMTIGSYAANRPTGMEGVIGRFANTLPLQADLREAPTFLQLWQQVKQTTVEAFAYQQLPFEHLLQEVKPDLYYSRQPPFATLFVYQVAAEEALNLPGLSLVPVVVGKGKLEVDLMLVLGDDANGAIGYWEYNASIFEETTIMAMTERYQKILAQVGQFLPATSS